MSWGEVELEPEVVDWYSSLTVFAKSRPNDRREVERARRAIAKCMNEHGMTGDES